MTMGMCPVYSRQLALEQYESCIGGQPTPYWHDVQYICARALAEPRFWQELPRRAEEVRLEFNKVNGRPVSMQDVCARHLICSVMLTLRTA